MVEEIIEFCAKVNLVSEKEMTLVYLVIIVLVIGVYEFYNLLFVRRVVVLPIYLDLD